MGECKTCVNPGPCKMNVVISAIMGDDFLVKIDIDTNCPNINKIKDSLPALDPYSEISGKTFSDSEIYKWACELPHVACPVPCAIVKSLEIAGDLALKKPVSFEYE